MCKHNAHQLPAAGLWFPVGFPFGIKLIGSQVLDYLIRLAGPLLPQQADHTVCIQMHGNNTNIVVEQVLDY
jgi:hypothetical protein